VTAVGNDVMGLEELAVYLQRDLREVTKMASRGNLPGRKVGGEWRFARAEINHWLETQLRDYDDRQLTAVETAGGHKLEQELLISALLPEACVAVPLAAATRGSVLRQMVSVAEQSWQVYDPDAIVEAIRQREEKASTALPCGVALPHPHRALPNALGESLIAYGRTASPIPFGAAMGGLTDIYFLICCRDDRTHLRVLARLSRLLLRPGFVDELRDAASPQETWELIAGEERSLIG